MIDRPMLKGQDEAAGCTWLALEHSPWWLTPSTVPGIDLLGSDPAG